jgi:hypothetical protein
MRPPRGRCDSGSGGRAGQAGVPGVNANRTRNRPLRGGAKAGTEGRPTGLYKSPPA